MPSKKFHSGQGLGSLRDHRWLNFVNDGAELAHGMPFGTSGTTTSQPRTTVLIRNDHGETVDRFGVLGITGVLITPESNEQQFLNGFALMGDAPDDDRDGPGRIAITLAPIASGKIGPAVLWGMVPVKLDLPDEETYTDAKFVADDTGKLETGGDIVVVWHEDGPGEKWALVHLGAGAGAKILRTQPTEDHESDAVVDHRIMETDEDGNATSKKDDADQDVTIEVRNQTGLQIPEDMDCSTFKPADSKIYFAFPWRCE